MTTQELVRRAGELADADLPDEAMELCNQVLVHEPDHPGALFVAGCVLLKAAKHVQALQLGKRICEVMPKDHRGYGLLCNVYGELHQYDNSVRMAEKAVALKRCAHTMANLCYAYTNCGQWDRAEEYGLTAVKMATGDDSLTAQDAMRDALVSLAHIKLAQGDWKAGFEGYRKTLRTKWRKEHQYGDSVEWWGEPDAVVIVTGEQGLGDELMAASVIPDAARACKTFIFDCDERLGDLLKRSFPNIIVSPTRRVDTVKLPVLPTHHKSLFGLSELFRKEDADFPRQPYLVPNSDYVRMFREYFRGPVTGLAWSGGLPRTGLEPRTAGLNAFLPLIRRGGTYVSLQYKDDAKEVAEFEAQHGIKIHRLPWVTQGRDVDLLAGLIASLDNVVGVHTSALHLSSAMGVPTTVLTHRGSGWRYAPKELLWYPPSTKMHRKQKGESWRECIARL